MTDKPQLQAARLSELDRRVHPWRDDLAASYLKGRVKSRRFVKGEKARIIRPSADLRKTPSDDGALETQLCFGAGFDIYDEKDGWAWGQAAFDGYVGYVRRDCLDKSVIAPTHIVSRRQSMIFAAPAAVAQRIMAIGMGAELAIDKQQDCEKGFVKIKTGGFIPEQHVQKISTHGVSAHGVSAHGVLAHGVSARSGDYAATAESLAGVPYLWGGCDARSGMDCSALVQLALRLSGIKAPRDSDMQEAQLGQDASSPLKRGDFIFWKAHAGIMLNEDILLHANAFHMAVAAEPLKEARARIKKIAGDITSIKRF